MLPFKALPSPQWGGEVCMGQSNTFSQNFTFKRYCLAPEPPQPKQPGRFPATVELVWRFSEVNKEMQCLYMM